MTAIVKMMTRNRSFTLHAGHWRLHKSARNLGQGSPLPKTDRAKDSDRELTMTAICFGERGWW